MRTDHNKKQIKSAIDFIKKYDSFIITSHQNIDGDAVGSILALGFIIEKLGKSATLLIEDKLPRELNFLENSDKIISCETFLSDNQKKEFDAIIIADAPNMERTGKVKDLIDTDLPLLVIDHHEKEEIETKVSCFVDQYSSSTSELSYKLGSALNIDFNKGIAEALMVGLIIDTGSFSFKSTTADSLKIASELLSLGVDIGYINQMLFQQENFETVKGLGDLLSSLELHIDEKLAIISFDSSYTSKEKFKKMNKEGMVNIPLKIRSVKISAFLRELDNNQTRISLRSKPGFDINKIAKKLDGGGHQNAAGCTILSELSKAKSRLIDLIKTDWNDIV